MFLGIASELKHGIAMIQKAGQTLMIPSYWSYMSSIVETSTSAGYSLATVLKYVERLVSIDLQVALIMTWPSISEQRTELIQYVENLAKHLDVIFNRTGSFEPCNAKDVIMEEVCNKWDEKVVEAPETLKAQVYWLCGLIEDEGECMRVQRIWESAWLEKLHRERKEEKEIDAGVLAL